MSCHNSLETNASLIVGSWHCVLVHNVNAHFTVAVMFPSFSVLHTEWLNCDMSTLNVVLNLVFLRLAEFQEAHCFRTRNPMEIEATRGVFLFGFRLAIAVCLPAFPLLRHSIKCNKVLF